MSAPCPASITSSNSWARSDQSLARTSARQRSQRPQGDVSSPTERSKACSRQLSPSATASIRLNCCCENSTRQTSSSDALASAARRKLDCIAQPKLVRSPGENKTRQWAGLPSRPARPDSWRYPSGVAGKSKCNTNPTSERSTPIPNATVATNTGASASKKCLRASSRRSTSRPA